eukprot:TRINITY_DN2511_c0_g1_i1.p1 TRINITY_DN2511_c0_g1~~TRINITY_DN2511_c0_g1_i1.p1  ORF type:complete len:666 (-),score=167.90 TRINITY_DN2511_c0_g1_i1:88-2085(-)
MKILKIVFCMLALGAMIGLEFWGVNGQLQTGQWMNPVVIGQTNPNDCSANSLAYSSPIANMLDGPTHVAVNNGNLVTFDVKQQGWRRVVFFSNTSSLSSGAAATFSLNSAGPTSGAQYYVPTSIYAYSDGTGDHIWIGNGTTSGNANSYIRFTGPFTNGMTPDGSQITSISRALGIAVDVQNSYTYALDSANNRVLRYTGNNYNTPTLNYNSSQLNLPKGILLDCTNQLWVLDTNNNRALRFALGNTTANLVLGQSDFATVTSGTTASKFNSPTGFAMTPGCGSLFVADTNNNRVLQFNGPFTTGMSASSVVVNTTQSCSWNNFNAPYGVAWDNATQRLWVADNYNSRIIGGYINSPSSNPSISTSSAPSASNTPSISTSNAPSASTSRAPSASNTPSISTSNAPSNSPSTSNTPSISTSNAPSTSASNAPSNSNSATPSSSPSYLSPPSESSTKSPSGSFSLSSSAFPSFTPSPSPSPAIITCSSFDYNTSTCYVNSSITLPPSPTDFTFNYTSLFIDGSLFINSSITLSSPQTIHSSQNISFGGTITVILVNTTGSDSLNLTLFYWNGTSSGQFDNIAVVDTTGAVRCGTGDYRENQMGVLVTMGACGGNVAGGGGGGNGLRIGIIVGVCVCAAGVILVLIVGAAGFVLYKKRQTRGGKSITF